MTNVQITIEQTIIMFLMMAVGCFLFKKGILSRSASGQLGALLLNAVLPFTIFNSFLAVGDDFPPVRMLTVLILCAIALALSAGIAFAAFKKDGIANFSAAFSNAGFMGVPLIQAVLGNSAVIYAAPFIAMLNVMQWTYGVYILTGRRDAVSARKILLNPILMSLVLGLAAALLKLRLPGILTRTISSVSAMNAPLAMLILGAYLAQMDLLSLFREKQLYLVCLLRLIVIPVLTVVLLKIIPNVDPVIAMSIVIAASAPVGANVAIYAEKNQLDYVRSCRVVCLSTLLSIFTMPLMILLFERFPI